MKRKITLVVAAIVCLCLSFPASAKRQNQTPDWKGIVMDEKGEAMPFVNVILLSLPDSTVIDGAITDEQGQYEIASHQINEELLVSMIGYQSVRISRGMDCNVRLQPTADMLGEAAVTAVMPKTKLTGEGLSTSVKGTVLENVGSARDALSRVPGVIRGREGLEVIGRGTPIIYINGRKMVDNTELDRLRSNEIQNVEVIENPGARYDASVSCVIRIKTFRPQGEGFGFNLGLTDAQSLVRKNFNDPSAYFKFNYRNKGLDVFGGVSGNLSHNSQDSQIEAQTFFDPKMTQSGPLVSLGESSSASVNAGMNYMIGDNHSLGFRVEYTRPLSLTSTLDLEENITLNSSPYELLSAHTDNAYTPGANQYNLSANLYYNGTFAQKLNVDFNADYYGSESSIKSRTHEISNVVPETDVNNENYSESRLYAAKLVLGYPVWKGMFQLGTEDTYSLRRSEYTISPEVLPASSSTVKEGNVAFFAEYGFALPKVGYFNAGLRYEYVSFDYKDAKGTGSEMNRKWGNFFPTLSYSCAFGPVQAQLIYSMKISRPSYAVLSGNMSYHSKYIYQGGNAKLQPQLTNQLSLTTRWQYLTFIAQYQRTDDAIVTWARPYNDKGVVMVKPENLVNPFRGLSWYFNWSPTFGIWTLNYTAGMQHQWLDVDMQAQTGYPAAKTVSFNNKPMIIVQAHNSFNFKYDWLLDLGVEYHSKAFYQNVYLTNNFCNLSASIQKSLLKDKSLVIRLSASDILGMTNSDVVTDYGFLDIAQTNRFDNKRITLSLTYRFNAASNKYRGTGAGRDAASRMQ